MNKWILTSAFCKAGMLRGCLENLGKQEGFTHVIIDQHYPVDKDHNRLEIQTLAFKHGAIYLDSGKDRGLHEGLNFAMSQIRVQPGDVLITLDPDDRPSPGSMQALADVMTHSPSLAVLGLSFSVIKQRVNEGIPFRKKEIAGHQVLIHPHVEMWNVAAYNPGFILEMGGFKQTFDYYGGIESALYENWRKKDMLLGYLQDFNSEHVPVSRQDSTIFDQDYQAWKMDHVSNKFKGSFEDYLIHCRRINEEAVDQAWEKNRT